VSGEDRVLRARAGLLTVRVAGAGAPMLLLHSVNAAASGAEVAPLHEWAAQHYRVYTPDLPGFGRSERSRRPYHPALYVEAIRDVLDLIEHEHESIGVVHALALSTSAEFLARAAMEEPARFASLALVTPTAFDRRAAKRTGEPGTTREIGWLKRLFSIPSVGRRAYALLTRPGVVRYFLERTFGTRSIDEDLWRYCCRSVRIEGARFAPLAFLSGSLFSADMLRVYRSLQGRVWLPHGTRGDFADFSGADWARQAPNWTVQAFASGAIPSFETPDEFMSSYARFLVQAP